MGKTKNCYIISESTGYSLNIDEDDTSLLKLSNTTKDLWTKHNWLIETVVRDESNYDDDYIEGRKSNCGLLRPASDPEGELRADDEQVLISKNLGDFYWAYDNGYLFSSDNPDMVLEAYEIEDAINLDGVRMAPRSGDIPQRWRILNEYEDEDPEFRPAFALGSHKMRADPSKDTKTICRPFTEDYGDQKLDLRGFDIKDIEWKRPEEIGAKPVFVKGGISRFDINQGFIGDCWAVSAIANLASTIKHQPKIMQQIFDPNQSFEDGNHSFTFNFFRNGEWIEVIVDDYLPWNTAKKKLLFVSSTEKLEFWPCLLEKAYAKFRGSYADLVGGWAGVALNDMTGDDWKYEYINEEEYYDLCDKVASYGLVLASTVSGESVNVDPDDRQLLNQHNDPVGLWSGHAYSITGFGGDVNHGKCLRLRNPWGQGEYSGPEANALNTDTDGEFVIKWSEFCKYFRAITVKA